jgi:hypothetical protein
MLEIYYYIFTIALAIIIVAGFKFYLKKTSIPKQKKNIQIFILIGGLLIWFIYLTILSFTGVLRNFDLPPRFPLLIMLPAIIFIIIFLRKNRKAEIITNIPNHIPLLFESFRIPVELLLHGTFLAGLIPIETTYSGYNFEIYFATSALIIGGLTYRNIISNKLILIWNILGLGFLATILAIFMTAIFYPSFWGETSPMVSLDLGTMPYMLVPGFYVPLAIFMHILSIIKVTKKPIK